MATVDVVTETLIARPREIVAAYAADPDNAPNWYANIKSVAWQTPPPLAIGSRFAFVTHFLERRLAYTYETVDFIPGARLSMRTADGPFPMETCYAWEDAAAGQTRMMLRNRGAPKGFSILLAPFLGAAMRAANKKALQMLKAILEHS